MATCAVLGSVCHLITQHCFPRAVPVLPGEHFTLPAQHKGQVWAQWGLAAQNPKPLGPQGLTWLEQDSSALLLPSAYFHRD